MVVGSPGRVHRLHFVGGRSDQVLYLLPKPDLAGRTALLARIYEVFPLICPACQTPLTFIACLTDPEPITQILAHIRHPGTDLVLRLRSARAGRSSFGALVPEIPS